MIWPLHLHCIMRGMIRSPASTAAELLIERRCGLRQMGPRDANADVKMRRKQASPLTVHARRLHPPW